MSGPSDDTATNTAPSDHAASETFTIICILPELLGTNGDAANARVLAQRARWAGHAARIVNVRERADLPEHVDAVVIGSGTDADLEPAREVLRSIVDELRQWSTSGVPILAVGTGWELLSWGVKTCADTVVDGLGLIPGRAVPRERRATGDLVVSSRHGRLVGFENHARDFVGAEASPLGRVASGVGNGNSNEGLLLGAIVGTHLHGPVLARNPALADHLLTVAFKRRGEDYAVGARARAADEIAAAANASVESRLSR